MEGQWYPGKMARALEQLGQDLKVIDLVLELIDARVPASSSNPALKKMLGKKSCLLLLHKADRADKDCTGQWIAYFHSQGEKALSFSVFDKNASLKLKNYLARQGKTLKPERLKRPLRLMVAGIPNVGKSTLINHLVRRSAARTGNQPGITRGRQWFRIMPDVELLDTPGLLWPKIGALNALPLAAVGALPEGRIDIYQTALWLLERYLEQERFDLLKKRYRELRPASPEELIEQVSRKSGCLLPGGRADLQRTAALVLKDYQDGSLGRLTLEAAPSLSGGRAGETGT